MTRAVVVDTKDIIFGWHGRFTTTQSYDDVHATLARRRQWSSSSVARRYAMSNVHRGIWDACNRRDDSRRSGEDVFSSGRLRGTARISAAGTHRGRLGLTRLHRGVVDIQTNTATPRISPAGSFHDREVKDGD